MTFEELQIKMEKEYEVKGLFPFLANHCNGESEDTITINTEDLELLSFDYISEHPDFEKHYIDEILNIIVQLEVKAFIEDSKQLQETIVDSEDKIVIGPTYRLQNYKKAKHFKTGISETICIDKNSLTVDDYGLVIGDLRKINLGNIGNASIKSFMLGGIK